VLIGPSGGRAGGDLRPAAPEARRGGGGGRGAARGPEASEQRHPGDFAGERLAPFKVPRKVVILDEIPKGCDRQAAAHRLAEKLGRARRWRRCDLHFFSAPARSAATWARSWLARRGRCQPRRAGAASGGDAGQRPDPDRGGRSEHGAGHGLRGSRRSWAAGLCDRHAEGAFGAAGGGAPCSR
jgi:hypothetical protein